MTLRASRSTIRSYGEWAELAEWFARSPEVDNRHVLWAVQCPRVYHVWRKSGHCPNFGVMLKNFFGPLFDATLRPEEHPQLANLITKIGCIDTVDNDPPSHRPSPPLSPCR